MKQDSKQLNKRKGIGRRGWDRGGGLGQEPIAEGAEGPSQGAQNKQTKQANVSTD